MNFGIDDPLGDISDDNDSFFDEPKAPAKRTSLTKTPEKKSVSDLFNLLDGKSEHKESLIKNDDWLGLEIKEETSIPDVKKSPAKVAKSGKKISFDDDDDLLGNLGLTKKTPSKTDTKLDASEKIHSDNPDKPSKKIDLLESILGPTKSEDKKITFDDILKESKTRSKEAKPQPLQSDLEQSDKFPRERRRGRRPSGNLMDPLGLFSNDSKTTDLSIKLKHDELDIFEDQKRPAVSEQADRPKPTQTKSTSNIPDQDLPDWLGGASVKSSKSEGTLIQKSEQPKQENIPQEPPKQSTEDVSTPVQMANLQVDDNQTLNALLTQQKLTHSSLEYQNTAIALQQQELQLLMALQLKKYEDRLAEMQLKQQELLMKQEKQFNTLLDQQFAKQQIMENNMRIQQERINNHIQMLISQPSVAKFPNSEELEELKKSASDESIKLYENIISSLKQRQHEEMFLLEDSYKKQITLLEQSLESITNRLKDDAEKLSGIFEGKLGVIEKQHEEEIIKYKQKIQEMETQHANELTQIRDNHTRVIEEIKFEYSTLVENIKQTRQSETSLFNESSSYIQKLDANISVLTNNSSALQEIEGKMEKDFGVLSKIKEESLRAKEQEIALMKTTLEKCRESAEQERTQLLGLVRSLETKIAEQNQNSREERWALQQAASTLAARSAALDRESEFNRASIERERDQLKTLKESILAEQEKMILQLTEEKLSIAAEKSRLETSSKLNMNYDAQRAKAEVEAVIQVAKEATEMADKERSNLQQKQCEIEKLKRTLSDRERKLSHRENELENLMRDAERKISEGEKAMFESKTVENKYNERLKELQSQLASLSIREKKIAEEKITLSRERLALHTLMRQTKKCGLCAVDAPRLEEISDMNVHLIHPYFGRFENMKNDVNRLHLEEIDGDYTVLNTEENVPI